jgi:hypothetical protein
MCPNNRIGTVDLFVVSRHGQPSSNSEALVHAIRPRVTIMNNGPRKGGQPAAMNVLLNSPRLEDLWQIHFALLGGQEYTVPGIFIANVEEGATVPVAPLPPAPRGAPAAAGTPAQWTGVLDQSVGPDRWQLHGDERAERVQQNVQGGKLAGSCTDYVDSASRSGWGVRALRSEKDVAPVGELHRGAGGGVGPSLA